MDLKDIKELIKFVSRAGVHEVQLEKDDFKIVIKTSEGNPRAEFGGQMMQMQPMQMQSGYQQQQAPQNQQQPAAEQKADEAKDSQLEIKAPMIGTFYRASGPDKDPFVKVGDTVQKGQVVCIIEAMKLFNEIESEVSGTVVKVLVDNANPVEYDQPLFLIDPS